MQTFPKSTSLHLESSLLHVTHGGGNASFLDPSKFLGTHVAYKGIIALWSGSMRLFEAST